MSTYPQFSPARLTRNRIMRNARYMGALVLAMICLSCGETNRQVFQRYEAQFAAKRDQFKKIAQMLPTSGSVKGTMPAKLSPSPVYNVKTDTYNTEIVMFDQLLDPDIESRDHNRLDLILAGDLLRCVQWTGPKNPMSSSALDQRAGNMEEQLKKALAIRYLVVVRPATYVAPTAVDENTYKPGMADIEVFITDMESNKVAGSFRYSAHSAAKVEYSYKKGESQASRLEEFAYSSLFTDARDQLAKLLTQTTGGQFVFER